MSLNLTPEELLAFLNRCMKADLSFKQIIIITEMDEQDLNTILVNNIRKKQNKKASPANVPNSYYIDRFKQGMTVKEIAAELKCNLSGLYKVLRVRGISPLTYLNKEEKK